MLNSLKNFEHGGFWGELICTYPVNSGMPFSLAKSSIIFENVERISERAS